MGQCHRGRAAHSAVKGSAGPPREEGAGGSLLGLPSSPLTEDSGEQEHKCKFFTRVFFLTLKLCAKVGAYVHLFLRWGKAIYSFYVFSKVVCDTLSPPQIYASFYEITPHTHTPFLLASGNLLSQPRGFLEGSLLMNCINNSHCLVPPGQLVPLTEEAGTCPRGLATLGYICWGPQMSPSQSAWQTQPE